MSSGAVRKRAFIDLKEGVGTEPLGEASRKWR
jgi:hypothetical protein